MTQVVRDAIADAETLRRVVEEIDRKDGHRLSGVAFCAARYLYAADATYAAKGDYPPTVALLAAQSARAAFKAVPSLRGAK